MTKVKNYTPKSITPQTRLSDLVNKKHHHLVKQMINELRSITTIDDDTEWWRVKRLDFKKLSKTNNYTPIARFIRLVGESKDKALKCSNDTFFYYISSPEHSNLNIKWKYLKSLVYRMIAEDFV